MLNVYSGPFAMHAALFSFVIDCSQPSSFSWFHLIVKRADKIARELDDSAERETRATLCVRGRPIINSLGLGSEKDDIFSLQFKSSHYCMVGLSSFAS